MNAPLFVPTMTTVLLMMRPFFPIAAQRDYTEEARHQGRAFDGVGTVTHFFCRAASYIASITALRYAASRAVTSTAGFPSIASRNESRPAGICVGRLVNGCLPSAPSMFLQVMYSF